MANGQTLDHHAKVSDQQIKRLVSNETDVPRGEVKHGNSGVKGRVYKGEITTMRRSQRSRLEGLPFVGTN